MERHAFRGKSTIVYLIYEEKTNPKAQYEKQTTQRENGLKCFAYSCLVFCLCLSLWRLSDLQIRTGKKNRQKNKNKLRQNVLHSGVLLLFVSVLFSGDSGRGSQICTFPWRKKTVVQINETKKETKKRNEIHSTRTRRVFVFFCADLGSPNLWRKNANRKQNTKMQITLAHFGFCFFCVFLWGVGVRVVVCCLFLLFLFCLVASQ